ncbi:hypothetical protein HK098_005634 [Nowakowskiella sp. JEL0407]|nr:hypothetical protein HK098_005634 [Nowakowskiella sp. JEL0407]
MATIQNLPPEILEYIFLPHENPHLLGRVCKYFRQTYTDLLVRLNSTSSPPKHYKIYKNPKNSIAYVRSQISLPLEKIPYVRHLRHLYKYSIARFYIEAICHAVRTDVEINEKYLHALTIFVCHSLKLQWAMGDVPIRLKIHWLRETSPTHSKRTRNLHVYEHLVYILCIHEKLYEIIEYATPNELKFVCVNKLFIYDVNFGVSAVAPRVRSSWNLDYLVVKLIEKNFSTDLNVELETVEELRSRSFSEYSFMEFLDLAVMCGSFDCFDVLASKQHWLQWRDNFTKHDLHCSDMTLKRLICTEKFEFFRFLFMYPQISWISDVRRLVDIAFRCAKDTETIDIVYQLESVASRKWINPSWQNVRIEFVDKYHTRLTPRSKVLIESARRLLADKWKGYDALVNFKGIGSLVSYHKIHVDIKGFYFGKWVDQNRFKSILYVGRITLKLLRKRKQLNEL